MGGAVSYLKHFGLPGAGLMFLFEGIGIPIPVEIPLLIISSPHQPYWAMVLLMWGSTVVGNTIGYFLGVHGGRPMALKFTRLIRMRPEAWERAEGWFRKHGLKMILVTRWINWGFAQNMWLCGITRVPFARFFVVMTINDFLWAMAWTRLVQTARRYSEHIGRFLHHKTMRVGLMAIAVLLVGLAVWWVLRRMRLRKQKPAEPTPPTSTDEPR